MINIPLSQIGSAEAFAADIERHRAARVAHLVSVGKPIPTASHWVEHVIQRQPQSGPVVSRGPDQFVVLPYRIVDDTPPTPEAEQALKVLRETIA
jgi:hypothetical protein